MRIVTTQQRQKSYYYESVIQPNGQQIKLTSLFEPQVRSQIVPAENDLLGQGANVTGLDFYSDFDHECDLKDPSEVPLLTIPSESSAERPTSPKPIWPRRYAPIETTDSQVACSPSPPQRQELLGLVYKGLQEKREIELP